jgi:hypothetical protein
LLIKILDLLTDSMALITDPLDTVFTTFNRYFLWGYLDLG